MAPIAPWTDAAQIWNNATGSSTRWGKAACVLWYLFLFLLLLQNVYQTFVPFSFGYDCFVLEADPYSYAFIDMLVRVWAIYYVGFTLYAACMGLSLINILFYDVIQATGLITFVILKSNFLDAAKTEAETECYNSMVSGDFIYILWPLVTAACWWTHQKQLSSQGTAGETTALV